MKTTRGGLLLATVLVATSLFASVPLEAQVRPPSTKSAVSPRTSPAEPIVGLRITAIDQARRLVTAHDAAAGRWVQIRVANRAQLRGLRVGQEVSANYANSQVALAARDLGRILSIWAGGTSNASPPPPPADVVARCREESKKQAGAGLICVPQGTEVPGPNGSTWSWTCVCS
jgi:hypothetical protein